VGDLGSIIVLGDPLEKGKVTHSRIVGVSSFQRMLTNGGPALGQAQSGAVATLIGAPLTLMVGAIICTVTILGILGRRRDLRAAEL